MAHPLVITIFISLFSLQFVHADTIFIHNESDFPLYGAPYYLYATLTQTSTPKLLPAHATVAFERPAFRFDLGGRRFVFSPLIEDLPVTMPEDQFRLLSSQDISEFFGDNFYIDLVKGHFESFNTVNWKFYQPIKKGLITPALASLSALTTGRLRKAYEKAPYNTMKAEVRIGKTIPPEELQYREKRKARTHKAFEKILGSAQKETPTIAVCLSGGGLRSALATAGLFSGLEKAGLLETITYAVGLSGSTWALGSWTHFGISAQEYKKKIIQQASHGLLGERFKVQGLSDYLFKKFIFGRPLSMSDVYGTALGHIFLDTGTGYSNEIYLSEQVQRVNQGQWVYPIYTAMLTKKPYEWLEFTPYRVGNNYLGGDIPSWAFNREFIKGNSVHNTPPEPLGFLFGIFGYAIGANFNELVAFSQNAIQPHFLRRLIEISLGESPLGRQRLLPAQVYNYTYAMPHLSRNNQEFLTLIDLGILFNLPLQPIIERPERKVDIIIILDNTDYRTSFVGNELRKAEKYFNGRGCKLPPMNLKNAKTNPCTVFKHPTDPSVPTIIYMPLIENKNFPQPFNPRDCTDSFCNTFNFQYTPEQARLLADLVEFNVVQSKQLIINTIQETIARKNGAYMQKDTRQSRLYRGRRRMTA